MSSVFILQYIHVQAKKFTQTFVWIWRLSLSVAVLQINLAVRLGWQVGLSNMKLFSKQSQILTKGTFKMHFRIRNPSLWNLKNKNNIVFTGSYSFHDKNIFICNLSLRIFDILSSVPRIGPDILLIPINITDQDSSLVVELKHFILGNGRRQIPIIRQISPPIWEIGHFYLFFTCFIHLPFHLFLKSFNQFNFYLLFHLFFLQKIQSIQVDILDIYWF